MLKNPGHITIPCVNLSMHILYFQMCAFAYIHAEASFSKMQAITKSADRYLSYHMPSHPPRVPSTRMFHFLLRSSP